MYIKYLYPYHFSVYTNLQMRYNDVSLSGEICPKFSRACKRTVLAEWKFGLPKKLWGIAGSDSRNSQIGKKTERQAKVVSWHVMLATIPISRYFLHQRHYQLGQVSLSLSLSRGESCLFSYINKFIKGSDHFNPLNFSLQPFKKNVIKNFKFENLKIIIH